MLFRDLEETNLPSLFEIQNPSLTSKRWGNRSLMRFASRCISKIRRCKLVRVSESAFVRSTPNWLPNFSKVESQLSEAVERDEFSLAFQPQYQCRNKHVIGFEALIRWKHDDRIVSPAEFIPVLESSGRIIEIGKWVLSECCQQLKKWELEGHDTRVAINISPVQFRDPAFYDSVVEILEMHDVDPSRIDLEITEGVIISDVNHTAETLNKLKALGCMISIDDFGTGYSSLAYLKNFPIDQLKIDREFVKDIPNGDDGMIASSIIVLGLSLGMEVLAEGVETEEQLAFLTLHDCECFQGYLGSKPVTAEQCSEMLANQQVANTTF